MKRFILLLCSIFSCAIICWGSASCSVDTSKSGSDTNSGLNNSDEKIEYTAKKPMYEWSDINDYMTLIAEFTNRGKENYNVFDDCLEYYRTEYKSTSSYEFYLLKPGDNNVNWLPDCLVKEFHIYKGESGRTDTITEYIMLYDEKLQNLTANDDVPDGINNCNISLSIILCPVEKNIEGNNFTLEFGDNYSGNMSKYVNIFIGESCIATCYYKTEASVSFNWFLDYFKKNLIRG